MPELKPRAVVIEKATGLEFFQQNHCTATSSPFGHFRTTEERIPKRKKPSPAPSEPVPQQEFLTVAEVAALLRCDPRSVINRIHDGDLDAVRDRRRWLVLVASYYRYKANLRNRRRK
jgi:excisionase family DNA binding protein